MDRELLLQVIESARRRLTARRAWWWGGRVAFGWAVLLLVLVLARAVLPVELPYAELAAAGMAIGLLVVGATRFVRQASPLFAAQVLDLRFACADRLATAIEVLTGRHRPTALTDAVVDDATEHAISIDVKRGLPAGPDRVAVAAVALTVFAIVAAGALRGLSLPGTPARDVARTIQQEGRRLERAAQAMEEQARAERARISRRAAPSIQRLGEALQRERMERSDALARLERLGKEIEGERRQVRARREQLAGEQPQPGPNLRSDLFKQRAAVDRTVRQIREIADRLAASKSPEEREALMRQLAALAGGGEEGNVPARARQQAETARQQVGQGDPSAAQRTLQQSASELDDLRAMLADEEGLQQAQRDLQRSAEQITRGVPGAPAEADQAPQAAARPGNAAPGDRPLPEGSGQEQTEVPQGPNQGTLPGQGAIIQKLGPRTQRLEADRKQSRVQGLQGEGRTTTSELLGPGRSAQVRAPAGRAVIAARADADRYMERMRIPPEYREIVRRYFEALAASR
jgi:hypothetical protein